MSDRISIDAVRHVARLARLEMPDNVLPRFTEQFQAILDYVDTLSLVNVTGVEPMAHAVKLVNVLREDVVGPSLPLALVLQNAPDSEPPFFKVPKVIGGEEDSAG